MGRKSFQNKTVLVISTLVFFTLGCGEERGGKVGASCSVVQDEGAAVIRCGDGTSARIENGENGENGLSGQNGASGHSMAMMIIPASPEQCESGGSTFFISYDINDNLVVDEEDEKIQSATLCNGSNGADGKDGLDGADGQDGADGKDGLDGADGKDGVDGQNGVDGSNGADGKDGVNAPPTAFTPVGVVNPCGDAPNRYDEVFLKLADGSVLASFSDDANGKNTRFSFLTAGTYMTTDGDKCTFTLNGQGDITSESHRY